ncbi:hypothetical protein SNEBB_003619 [Seison nebaliae]|nr:hypothetical protein SNEBB_003619 [Seison nebaliae]
MKQEDYENGYVAADFVTFNLGLNFLHQLSELRPICLKIFIRRPMEEDMSGEGCGVKFGNTSQQYESDFVYWKFAQKYNLTDCSSHNSPMHNSKYQLIKYRSKEYRFWDICLLTILFEPNKIRKVVKFYIQF